MTRLPHAVVLAAVVLLGMVVLTAAPAPAAPRTDMPRNDGGAREDGGLELLRQAAVAGRTQEYSGVRSVTMATGAGTVSATLEVRNTAGAGLSVRTRAAGGGGTWSTGIDPGSLAGGLAAPHEGMLDVLARNYDIVTAGGGTVCGRSARIVLALRDDGTTAARFWLDDATRLVLRREIMDAHGRVSRDDAFTDVAIPHPHLPAATARSGVLATPAGPAAEVPDAATLDTLRRHGWRFAETLPGRFELFTAGEMEGDRTTGPYVYLGYSDGLSVVSVFIQPGHLDEEHLTGWHAHVRAGHTIWTRDSSGQAQGQEAIWASGGQVYTVLADAPAEVVDAAIAAFPHEREPGLWARMALGAARLLAWVNPFGE